MSLVNHILLIQRIDQLIRMRSTGTPLEFTQKLEISLSYWHKLKRVLIEDLNFPIAYDHLSRTYYYTREGKFFFHFEEKN